MRAPPRQHSVGPTGWAAAEKTGQQDSHWTGLTDAPPEVPAAAGRPRGVVAYSKQGGLPRASAVIARPTREVGSWTDTC